MDTQRIYSIGDNMDMEVIIIVDHAHRNMAIVEKYKTAINQCAFPDCNNASELIVHHVVPLSVGGTDTYDNLICICADCHNTKGLHSNSFELLNKTFYYKIYSELIILGFDSASCEGNIFGKKLTEFLKNDKEKETIKNIGQFNKNLYLKTEKKVKNIIEKNKEHKYKLLCEKRNIIKCCEHNKCMSGYEKMCMEISTLSNLF